MARSYQDEFVMSTLRDAFFCDPHQLLTDLTTDADEPLLTLWRRLAAERSERGEETVPPTGLNVALITFGPSRACALVTMPRACSGEPNFVALVAADTSFRYLTLVCPDDPEEAAAGLGRLYEWTSIGTPIDPDITVPLSPSEFAYAVHQYVS